jgi:hypothetical protein
MIAASAPPAFQGCLPPGVGLTDPLSTGRTVEERLLQLHARCDGSRMRDGAGREIRFYPLAGCWGNPPADAQDILAAQRAEVEALRQTSEVIEIPCGRGADLRRIR